MKNYFLLMLSFLTLGSCATNEAKRAYQMLKDDKAVIVDVREKEEVEQGMIKGALWFPLSKLESDKDWKENFLSMTEGKKIFLHCRSGVRSEKMLKALQKEGIEAENLGGYEAIKRELN